MTDVRHGERDKRRVACNVGRALGLGMPHQRADLDLPVGDDNRIEPRNGIDVDQRGRTVEPHVEGGNETLAAGKQPRLLLLQQVDGVGNRASPGIGEWRRLQAALPRAF